MVAQGGASLAEQLAQALPHMRGARPPATPVCQATMRIPADDLDGAFGEVRDEVSRWMQDRAGRSLPAEAWRGEGFQLAGDDPLRVEAAPTPEDGRWTARLEEADGDAPDRLWTTEAEIAKDEDAISVHVRRGCAARGESPPVLSVPDLVRWIADRFRVLVDGRPIGAGPRLVDTPKRAEKLLALLCDPERERDVLAIATHDRDDDPSTTLLAPRSVFQRTLGAAHVAVVTATATFAAANRERAHRSPSPRGEPPPHCRAHPSFRPPPRGMHGRTRCGGKTRNSGPRI